MRGSAGHYTHLWEVIVFGCAACGGQITFTTDSWTWKDMNTKSATRLPPSERVSQMSHRWVKDTVVLGVYRVYSCRSGQNVCTSMYVGGHVSSFLRWSKPRRKTWQLNIFDCGGFGLQNTNLVHSDWKFLNISCLTTSKQQVIITMPDDVSQVLM